MKHLIIIWAFLLGVFTRDINNARAYRNNNLDIGTLDIGLVLYSCPLVVEDKQAGRVGQIRENTGENTQEKKGGGEANFEGIIQRYSEQYSVSPSLVKCIIWYESTNNPDAVGSAGEQGLAQFLPPTWRSFRKQMGESQEVSPFNPEEAVKTLAFALSKGWGYHWSVYGKCIK